MEAIKTILVPYGGREDEDNALKVAFDLAEEFSAHAQILFIAPDPAIFLPAAYTGIDTPIPNAKSVTEEVEAANAARLALAKERYDRLVIAGGIAQDDGVLMPTRANSSFANTTGDAEQVVAVQGRMADLVVMSRQYQCGGIECENAVKSSLFDTGRALLLVPPGELPRHVPRRIAIAWNGSAQATRAVVAAMAFLSCAEAVKVVTIENGDSQDFPVTPHQLCHYLERHGIEAEAVSTDDNGLSTGAAILGAARQMDADMVVLGAYSHSRLREMILGGVTEFMLHKTDISVLMAH